MASEIKSAEFFNDITVKSPTRKSNHLPSFDAEYARIELTTYDQLKQHLCKPLFFRYHDHLGTRCSIDWTDERRDSKCYYYPSRDSNAISPPTVATEGTLLARLERWMRGDLNFDAAKATISHSNLEDELDAQAGALVKALDDALAEAERKLQFVLAPPGDRRRAEVASVAETQDDAQHTLAPTGSQSPIEEGR
jgi:hypothetical protein